MGQYYRPLLICATGEKYSACAHDFDNGIKLMEHSWIGNNFVNVILNKIKDTPTRVAWIGDYAETMVDEECDFGGGFITTREAFEKEFNQVWGKDNGIDLPPDSEEFNLHLDNVEGYYLVNATKKCYIDIEDYVKQNSIYNRFGDSGTWCVNPLPLLTCVGNGLGGGDYYSDVGREDVGSWAFDVIYITYLRPSNLEEIMYYFSE